MKPRRLATAASVSVLAAGLGIVAVPAATASSGSPGSVFVLTNDESGNAVVTYARDARGHLTETGRTSTGGLGGSLPGAGVDPLASQGALTYDRAHHLLLAVNAGSDTLAAFSVRHGHLRDRQVVATNGELPVSVGVGRGVVYVLNAGGDGSVSGYRIRSGRLHAIPGSTRSLGLGNDPVPGFLTAPSQVAVTPDGRDVVVATKTHGTLETFALDEHGRPSAAPLVTAAPTGSVPFALSFDRAAHLLVAGAAGGAWSYDVSGDGTLRPISGFVPNGQRATCWTVFVHGYLYAANAGSATISGYRVTGGALSLLNADGVTAPTDAGPIDLAATGNGRFVYQLATGAGVLDELAVGADGSLTRIGTVPGIGVNDGHGVEGIAAS